MLHVLQFSALSLSVTPSRSRHHGCLLPPCIYNHCQRLPDFSFLCLSVCLRLAVYLTDSFSTSHIVVILCAKLVKYCLSCLRWFGVNHFIMSRLNPKRTCRICAWFREQLDSEWHHLNWLFWLLPCQNHLFRHATHLCSTGHLSAFCCEKTPRLQRICVCSGWKWWQSAQRPADESFCSSNLYKVITDILSSPYLDFLTPPPHSPHGLTVVI